VPSSPAATTKLDQARPWVNRFAWSVQVATLGLAIGSALASHSRPVQVAGTFVAWAVWAVGLLAVVIAHPIGLTTVRLAMTALIGATVWVCLSSGVPLWQKAASVIGLLVVLATVGSAETTTWCMDGPAYPNESRHALKTPIGLLPITVAVCALTVGSWVMFPLLIAAKAWVVGIICGAVAAGMAWLGTRSLHQLSRRFVVFVPAGFVVHDHLVLLDPVLFRKNVVDSIAPALAGTDSLDLTLGATGMPLEVLLHEKVELTKLSADRKTGEAGRTARFLISPVRPGAVVREAQARRYSTSLKTSQS
jgi:hypothetical protein